MISIHSMVSAQSENIRTIHLNCIDTSLESAIREIQRQTNIEFIYDARLIMNQTVTCRIENVTVRDAITLLLKQTPISFQIFPPNSIVFYEDKTSSQKIAGVVVDRLSQEGLPQANIALKNSERGTATDESGYFKLENMRTEICTLMVCYMGYQPLEILVDNSNIDPLKVEMDQNPVQMPPVVISETRIPDIPIMDQYGKIQFIPVEIKSLPSSADRDILHSLQTIPGTKSIFDHLDGLYVQGGTPDQNLILFDNIPVFRAEHLWGYMNVFNPNAIKQVHFYKVGFPCRYGDKLSSVVGLKGDVGQDEKIRFGMGADFFSANSHIQLPFNSKLRCAFSLRQSFHKIGLREMYYNTEDYLFLLKRRYRTNLNQGNMFRFYDMTGKINYQFSPQNTLSFTLFTTHDKIDITKRSESQGKIEGTRFEKWTNNGMGLTWVTRWTSRSQSHLSMTWADYQNEYLYQYRLTAERIQYLPDSTIARLYYDIPVREYDQFRISQFNFKCNYSLRVNPFYEIDTGVNVSYTKVKHQLPLEHYFTIEQSVPIEDTYHLSIELPANFRAWKHVLYADNRLKIQKHSEIVIGCRSIYYEPLNTFYIDPRVGITSNWSRFSLNLKWGHYHQFLHRMSVRAGDFNPMRTSYYWALADERLKTEFSEHRSIGFDVDWDNYHMGINVYQKKNKNLLFLVPTIFDYFFHFSAPMSEMTENFSSDIIYIDRGSSTSQGIEFLLQRKYGAISGWFTYQIGRSEYRFKTINQGKSFLAEYDRTHEINWVTQFAWRNLILSFSTIYATGTPFSTAEHTVFGSPIEHDFYTYCDRSIIKNERLPSYNRFDVKLIHHIKIFSSFELEYGCTLLNIFNQTNVIDQYYQSYEDMKNDQVTDITEPGRTLFIFCNLSH